MRGVGPSEGDRLHGHRLNRFLHSHLENGYQGRLFPVMKILSTTSSFGKLDHAAADFLRSTGHILERNPHGRTLTEDEVIEFLECHRPPGIIAGVEPLTGRVLHGAAAYLKVISRCGTGLDNVDLDTAKELGIVVMNTPEAPAEAVAELTIGLIFALLRNIVIHNQVVCGGSWAKKTGYLISETTVGIVGLGRIGRRVGTFLDLLGAKVVACDVAPDHAWLAAHPRVMLLQAEEVLAASDLVTLHLPSAAGDLHHYLNSSRLARMKPGAYLVNTSRGALIDEAALVAALASEHLAGAALDVFEHEPYQGPLLRQANVILSPHVGSYARATRARMEMEAAQNLLQAFTESVVANR